MKRNVFKKLLALTLALCMCLSLAAPAGASWWDLWSTLTDDSASAAETESVSVQSSDSFYRILHLDCGRKYFTKDWIIALINEMAAAGYNQLQLAFGNDGLRFLLDDMSFTANGTTYDHSTVVSKVEVGNTAQNSSGDKCWLTQREMDDIIAYAQSKGIEIVPLLNLPGHANAILDIVDNAYNASGSDNTLNVAGDGAEVDFGYALFVKYVDYFASKGCKFFNFGADEYANDASGTFSFSRLNSTQYASFVGFINKLANYIKEKGMTPRSFNDGLYYNGQSASIDTGIQCCYWSSGWSGYSVASVSTIADKGHAMINTHGDYYYVLGKDDKFDSGYSYASNFSNTTFMGGTISAPVGSMFCIWCDYPNAETETEVAQKVRLPLRAMAARMQDQSIESISTDVVSGGFNTDGSINVPSATVENVTKADTNTGVTVTALGLTSVQVTAGTASVDDNVVSKTYTITLNDGTYTGAATVKIPYDTAFNGYNTIYGMVGDDRFAVTVQDGYFVCDVPHFSDVTLYGENNTAESGGTTVNVNLEVGTTSAPYTHENVNDEAKVDKNDLNESIATVAVTGQDAVAESPTRQLGNKVNFGNNVAGTQNGLISDGNGNYLVVDDTGTIGWTSDINQATTTTTTTTTTTWGMVTVYIASIQANGYYLYVDNATLKSSETEPASNVWRCSSRNEIYWKKVGLGGNEYYLNCSGSAWSVSTGTSSKAYLYSYTNETTPATPASTTITFTGTGEGDTTVKVGDTTYNIHVTAPTNKESKTMIVNNELSLPTGAVEVSSSERSVVAYEDGELVAEAAGTATVTFVTKNSGGKVTARYTWTITVTNEDLSQVDSLTLEHWITNSHVVDTEYATSDWTTTISATEAYGENGIAVGNKAFDPGYQNNTDSEVAFWKAVRHPSSDKQTIEGGDDKSSKGINLTHVRYYNGNWSYLTTAGIWENFNDNDQLVAYYVQKQDVTKEITSYYKDWGHTYNANPYGSSNGYVALTVAVVYPDGTVSPAEANMASSSTTIFNYWSGRNIGVVIPQNNSDYTVSKITVTNGTGTCSDWNNLSSTLEWDKKTLEDGESEWYDETIVWDKSNGTDPIVDATDGTNPKLVWSNSNTAKLILIYLEVEEKETNLNVVWHDRTADVEITSMQVAMEYTTGGTVPTYTTTLKNASGDVIGTTKNWSGKTSADQSYLPDDAYVTNVSGVKQTFNKDLVTNGKTTGVYKSGLYQYDGAMISDDGKTLTLYYVLDSSKLSATYVVDFGLPVKITVSDIAENVQNVTWSTQPKTGTVVYDSDDGVITYTPTKTLPDLVSLAFTFNFGNSNQVIRIGIIPASNVLYEENFLTESTTIGTSYAEWSHTAGSSVPTQQTQQVDGTGSYSVFGYDDAYESSINGNSLGSAWTIDNLTSGNGSKYLTTTFYGTGFDLIGTAGSNTGMVYLSITNSEKTKLYIIDTSYVDGSSTTLYQVPLVHIMGLEEEVHTVNVRAAYRKATSAASAASTYSAKGGYDVAEDIYAMLDELYMDGFEIDDIELIGFQDDIYSGTYAAETETTGTQARPEGTTVTIDGFRVYQSTKNKNYPTNEQDVQYVNVLDAVKLSGSQVYAEFNDLFELKSREDYEANGGPQNEIYLQTGQSVVFQTSLDKDTEIQITARAVGSGATNLNGTEIGSNTEMYYKVTVGDDGVVTIANMSGKNTDGMLAISNLKVPDNTIFTTVTEESYEVASLMLMSYAVGPIEPETPVEEGFQPEKFDAKVKSVNLFSKKIVTLTITTSTDVETLTVNGKILTPTNAWLVKMGWSDTYTYVYVDTVKRSETAEFKIIAKNADGAEYTETCTG